MVEYKFKDNSFKNVYINPIRRANKCKENYLSGNLLILRNLKKSNLF